MDDMRVGAAFRAVRVRRRWRQDDVAARAGVARSVVSEIERGHLDTTSLARLRSVAAALDVRLDVIARWRGGDLARLLNARHSALHEQVARHLGQLPSWSFVPEVSFSVYGERGVIDILAFHPDSGSLLVIELKTAIVDVNDLVGTLDRKARLAIGIAADRGWQARTASRWVIVAHGRTNERRIQSHRSMLRAAFPTDGRAMRGWLTQPAGTISALSTWSPGTGTGTGTRDGTGTGTGRTDAQRIRVRTGATQRH